MNMADPFSGSDIDAKLREITDAIRAHDEVIKNFTVARDQLAEHFRRLSEARETIAREFEAISKLPMNLTLPAAPHGATPPASTPEEEGSPTLKSKILEILADWPSGEGASASEVTRALSARGEGTHVVPRVFYSMVYLNLMRLTETGELKFTKAERGRRFYVPKKEKP